MENQQHVVPFRSPVRGCGDTSPAEAEAVIERHHVILAGQHDPFLSAPVGFRNHFHHQMRGDFLMAVFREDIESEDCLPRPVFLMA